VLLVPLEFDRLELARTVARQWASGDVLPARLLGVVFVPTNSKRISKDLRAAAGIVGGGVPRTWWMPWLASFHSPKKSNLPPAAQKVLADITTLTRKI
jgi:hypothetical protein